MLVPIIGLMSLLLFEILTNKTTKSPIPLYFVIGLFAFTLIWLILGELRTKIIKVILEDGKITVTNFLGLGTKKVFNLDELDGFSISFLPSQGGTYEYLYLILNNKKVVKISEFYHKNYSEFKQVIILKTRDLGNERFSYIKELREIFT